MSSMLDNKTIENSLVSIVTPVYNNADFVEKTIESVKNQTYDNWEMILIDDKSNDNSLDIINKFASRDSRIKIIKNKNNLGAGVSRNKAIKLARGKYIAFLDGDDIWKENKLEIQIGLMDKNKWEFSHTSYGYITEFGKKLNKTYQVKSQPVGYYDLLKRTDIGCLTAVYNQEMLGKYYMSEHRRKQDYALWLSILKDGFRSFPIEQELAYYRQNPKGATNKKYALIFEHVIFLKDTQNFSILKSIYYTFHWAFNGFVKFYLK